MGAAILDRKSWGPPSWTGSDVKNAKVTPILLSCLNFSREEVTANVTIFRETVDADSVLFVPVVKQGK